jgi:putative FmdB family regulatory protein
MPLYLYRCNTCGNEVEELQKMGANEPPTPACLEGGTCIMTKVLCATGFKFVGEGWGGLEATSEHFAQRVIKGKVQTLAPKKRRPVADAADVKTTTVTDSNTKVDSDTV